MIATDDQFTVVRNAEEQYSIWPRERELPPGWESSGFTGSREEALAEIGRVWTDMRPASLRRWMDERAAGA